MQNWRENVRTMVPYVPGEQPKSGNVIKLNTNENPYPPAPEVSGAIRRMSAESMRLYPDPSSTELKSVLARRYGVGENQIFVGVGSDDVLSMSFLTFFNSKKPILFPDITYSFYDVWADLYRIPYLLRPLKDDFRIRREDYYLVNGGIVFPNPNAPTGLYENLDLVEDILKHNPDVVVIVDEAYIDFAGAPSAISLVPKYENLLVVQTFSKSRSLAGMRIGFAVGSEALISALNDVRNSFNSYTMSRAAQEIGTASVLNEAYFRETTEKIIRTREQAKKDLSELGFTYPDSSSNFIFAAHRSVPAKVLFAELKKRNIYVRYFDRPRISNYLRITVGTDSQMAALKEALSQIIAEQENQRG
ncbi:MAG: histidinol-phosphate transaminase [Lachnospiraceae bacterium]|jgi:histidinol-phosphate aminotransferase